MKDLPAGWAIMETWVPLTYRHELMFQPYVWTTRDVKDHWWSRAKRRTGWFPYGGRWSTYDRAAEFIEVTNKAMSAPKIRPSAGGLEEGRRRKTR